MLQFVIDGDPMAAPRPRVRQIRTKDGRNFASAYNPAAYQKYRDAGRYIIQMATQGKNLIRDAVIVVVNIHIPIPTSFSGKKQRLAEQGLLRPVTRPDVDNYLKTALDLLTGLVLTDDSIVVGCTVNKWYGLKPRMEIQVSELKPEGLFDNSRLALMRE